VAEAQKPRAAAVSPSKPIAAVAARPDAKAISTGRHLLIDSLRNRAEADALVASLGPLNAAVLTGSTGGSEIYNVVVPFPG
jgi:hypothetical protein